MRLAALQDGDGSHVQVRSGGELGTWARASWSHSRSARISTHAAEEYSAPGYFLDGLTEDSSWKEIQSKPASGWSCRRSPWIDVRVTGQRVHRRLDAGGLPIPRLDNGVRVSADELRAQVRTARAADPEP